MPKGGARQNSGPAPDPMALRRDRKDDASWVTLPPAGSVPEAPTYPLAKPQRFRLEPGEHGALRVFDEDKTEDFWTQEQEIWVELWQKPQASQWLKLGQEREVAAYVRAYVESVQADASASLKTAVLRMAGEIGLSLPGMHSLRWRFQDEKPVLDAPVVPATTSRRPRARPSSYERFLKVVDDEEEDAAA